MDLYQKEQQQKHPPTYKASSREHRTKDLTTTEGTTEMMEHLGVPQPLITKINNLMNKGKFKIVVAGKSSEEAEI